MTPLKFPIVFHQKPTKLELVAIISLLSITFIPFIYGIITTQTQFCYSLLLGIIGIKVFNSSTKNKFTHAIMIQKNTVISFNESTIEITKNQNKTFHNWIDLQAIEINIFSFKGKTHGPEMFYDGTENSIRFIKDKTAFEYFFFIENSNQFDLVSEQFKNKILPKTLHYNNIKNKTISAST